MSTPTIEQDLFSAEQMVQASFVSEMKDLSDDEFEKVETHASELLSMVEKGEIESPRFLKPFVRAVQLTKALREEYQALKDGTRLDPGKNGFISPELDIG